MKNLNSKIRSELHNECYDITRVNTLAFKQKFAPPAIKPGERSLDFGGGIIEFREMYYSYI
jgi:hypothetical protein